MTSKEQKSDDGIVFLKVPSTWTAAQVDQLARELELAIQSSSLKFVEHFVILPDRIDIMSREDVITFLTEMIRALKVSEVEKVT